MDKKKKKKVNVARNNVGISGGDKRGVVVGDASIVDMNIFNAAKVNRSTLRLWWHNVIRMHGSHSCYAIFLVLPTDKEAIKYLTEYGKELHIISGENCLVIVLSKNDFKINIFPDEVWYAIADEHSNEGYSVKIAQLFEIPITEFPCMLFFKDIRSSEHALISIKNLSFEQISEKMRTIFSIVHKSINDKKEILSELKNNQQISINKVKQDAMLNKIGSFAEKTLEAAIKALIESNVK